MAVNNSQINPPGNSTSPSASQPNSTMGSPYLSETLAVLITKYIFFALLALFGVIGNGLVVLVTIKRRAFKSSLDLFVKNLAIADLGFLLLVTPSGVLRAEIPYRWPLGEFICIYIYPSVEVFHGASVWIIAAIALERYRNIVGMARIRRNSHTKRSAKLLMAVVWVFSFIVFTIPIYVAVVFKDDDGSRRMCTMDWREPKGEQIGSKLYLGLLVFFSYILPLSVVIWTYVAISKQLRRSNTFLRGFKGIISRKTAKKIRKLENSVRNYEVDQSAGGSASTPGPHVQNHTLLAPVDSHRLTQNKRAKNILTPVAVLFAVSMLPINILRVLLLFWTPIVSEKYYKIIFFIAVIFTAANSSLNPVVYSIVSREFRNALKSLFNQKPRALSKSSASTGLTVQESTERRRFDTATSAPATKESEEPNMNNSCSCIVTDTKL